MPTVAALSSGSAPPVAAVPAIAARACRSVTQELSAVGGVDALGEDLELAGGDHQTVAPGLDQLLQPVSSLTIVGTPHASASAGA